MLACVAKTAEKRAFSYRFYPTDDQIAVLSRTFGCVRKVYNLALEARMSAWQMLEYKARWYGRNLIVIGRWYPSTRLCSGCGSLSKQLRLADRLWTCECGATRDRDINAAKNILAAGLAES